MIYDRILLGSLGRCVSFSLLVRVRLFLGEILREQVRSSASIRYTASHSYQTNQAASLFFVGMSETFPRAGPSRLCRVHHSGVGRSVSLQNWIFYLADLEPELSSNFPVAHASQFSASLGAESVPVSSNNTYMSLEENSRRRNHTEELPPH